ncbi:lysozyme [Edaphobacter acidisoli]|uniref:Lysozyme n=1 Tax=Edaphobacter acidisoli TaxID=2040573 RepID=A0A916W5X7_9BACT|nr:lysozyme [Edaphobacter acidisoli]GGA70477.1 lysozyme [Edaphobacter acidisoli]
MTELGYGAAGMALTRSFEGLNLTAYVDQRGVWTVGYGHTGTGVHGGMTITTDEAEALLASDIAGAVAGVNRLVTRVVSQNQFDALVDFAFNLGCASLARSTLLRCVNDGDFAAAAKEFLLWDHVQGRVVPGLLRRRQAEMELFERVN